MRELVVSFLSAALIVGATGTAVAEPQRSNTLRFCSESWAPYVMGDEDGKVGGLVVDILEIIAADMGKTVEVELLTYARCTASTLEGQFDAQIGVDYREAALTTIHEPFFWWSIAAMVRQDWPSDGLDDMDAFAGKTMVLVGGYDYPEAVTERVDMDTLLLHADTNDDREFASRVVKVLELGRADVVFDDEAWMRWRVMKLHDSVKVLSPAIEVVPQYVGFGPNKNALANAFAGAVDRVVDDQLLADVYGRYLAGDASRVLIDWRMKAGS